jgi:uncharacterized protein (TIGR00251 family)
MSFFRWKDETTLVLTIRVVPGSKSTQFGEIKDDTLRVLIKAQPKDNEANEALIRFLSKEFKAPQAKIRIVSGGTSKSKVVEIECPRNIPQIINNP